MVLLFMLSCEVVLLFNRSIFVFVLEINLGLFFWIFRKDCDNLLFAGYLGWVMKVWMELRFLGL